MLTVCYGCDMVNVSYVNFAAIGRNVAKVTAICSCDSVDNNPSLLGVVHVMWKPHIDVEVAVSMALLINLFVVRWKLEQ